MSDRGLIFNAKGAQIGYIEADRAFDLTGRERCKYARATSNLSKLNSKKADEVPVPHPEPTAGAPDQTKSTTENELLGRAIGMIRSALEKGSE